MNVNRGAWVAQLVKRLTLNISSECDPVVVGLSPISVKPAWDSLSPSHSAPSLLVLMFSLILSLSKINK